MIKGMKHRDQCYEQTNWLPWRRPFSDQDNKRIVKGMIVMKKGWKMKEKIWNKPVTCKNLSLAQVPYPIQQWRHTAVTSSNRFDHQVVVRWVHILQSAFQTQLLPKANLCGWWHATEGTRKVGRPKLRWEECVCQDIRILGVKNWRSVAMNREEWWIILRKARAHQGLSCQWWWWWWWHAYPVMMSFHVYRIGLVVRGVVETIVRNQNCLVWVLHVLFIFHIIQVHINTRQDCQTYVARQ
jgi:hypothetical protein